MRRPPHFTRNIAAHLPFIWKSRPIDQGVLESDETDFKILQPSGTEVIRADIATYVKEGPKITMKREGAGTTAGTIEGDTLVMNNERTMFVYRKD